MGECTGDEIRGGARSGEGVGAGSSIIFNVRSMRPSSSPPSSHLDIKTHTSLLSFHSLHSPYAYTSAKFSNTITHAHLITCVDMCVSASECVCVEGECMHACVHV